MTSEVIDVRFQVTGDAIPADHGYPLFGALARLVPALHENPSWGVHPVLGAPSVRDTLRLTAESRVTVRLPAEHVGLLLPLVNVELGVAGRRLRLGCPELVPLEPRPVLGARWVTIKGFHEEREAFVGAVERQLAAMELEGVDVDAGLRRVVKVHGKLVVGFPVVLRRLSPAASVLVQARGIGGRRHMGGGVFTRMSSAAW